MTTRYADVLRSIHAPLAVKALRAGAAALEERPRLLATIAGLETTIAEQARRIRELEGQAT